MTADGRERDDRGGGGGAAGAVAREEVGANGTALAATAQLTTYAGNDA